MNLLQDVRYGARVLMKSPGTTLVMLLILGVGIGANTAIFSFVDALFLKPLAVSQADALVKVFAKGPSGHYGAGFSYPEYALLRDRNSAFSALARVAPTTILEDATVPRSELARMIRFVSAVAAKYKLRIGTFGHMGDGNLHPTFLTDERDADQMRRVEEALKEIFDEAIRLGGTITGEHGVGMAKKSFLPKFAGEAQMRVMREFRRALDPNGILNPGKMF